MLIDALLILVGVALVLWGADRMTEGASSMARTMKVPEMIIGLTIVAAGTSAPTLFVSAVSAIKGTPDMAIGNVLGSNIFNTLLIVGCSAMVAPMTIAKTTVRKDIPFSVAASFVVLMLCVDGFSTLSLNGNLITRSDGFVLLAFFAVFMSYTLKTARGGQSEEEAPPQGHTTLFMSSLWIVVGLGCLVAGSNLFVGSASAVASVLGMSDSVIGLTIVAGGTSLPELATSVVAARKGKSAIAIGNVIGSNVFNLFAILGLTAVITPLRIGGITLVDMSVLLGSVLLVWFFSYTKYTIARWEGAVLTAIFLGYMGWLLYRL